MLWLTNPIVEFLKMNDGTSFSLFQSLVCSSTVVISNLPCKVLCGIIIQKLRITCSQTKTNPTLSFTTIALSKLNKQSNLSHSNKPQELKQESKHTIHKQSHLLQVIHSSKTEERRSLIDPNYVKDTTFCFPGSKEDSFQGKGMKLR